MPLRIGYSRSLCDTIFTTNVTNNPVREHFSSPLLQYVEADGGKTFTLVECPSKQTSYRLQRIRYSNLGLAKVEPGK